MKIKCKLFVSSIFAVGILLSSVTANAQKRVKHPVAKQKIAQHHKGEMAQAIKVLKRTNKIILVAHGHIKRSKIYTGDFAKAVHHQRHAKKLLKTHKAHRAMQHSRVARMYALKSIKANKGMVNKEMEFNDEENKIMGEKISDAELEKELKDSNPNIKFDDATISDKEMTELQVLETDEADYKNE